MGGLQFEDRIGLNGLIARFDYSGGTNPIYIGYAEPGTAEGSSRWQIKKLTFDGNDNVTAINFAGSNNLFSHSWTDRASHIYG